MDLYYCSGEDGYAYYAKGHVPLDDFMTALRNETDETDTIRDAMPTHVWKRVVRDFQAECPLLVEAQPESRGAFRATWIESI
jgi:hypothetical protein